MITIGFCTRKHNPEHIEHLKKTCGHPKVEIIEIINNGDRSLTSCYNEILRRSKFNIITYVHDDITLETKQWGKKLMKQFDNNPEYGIIGVAGAKYMSTTGRWWDDKRTMYGRVKHTHEGKSWLSSYSADQGDRLEEVINVDGVFFSVHKGRIKKNFDETVEGFHFYDVVFSFQNHLEGVKVGVSTKIRVNHQSIGQTNNQWEDNRKIFAENYAESLPIRINEPFNDRKLRVMIPHFNENESLGDIIKLAGELHGMNCLVSVVSNTDDRLTVMNAKRNHIKLYSLQEPPSFKLGDGKFAVNSPDGPVLSEVNKVYKVTQADFDIVYSDNSEIIASYKGMYPECKFVDIGTDEFLDMDKTPENYKEHFVKVFNDEIEDEDEDDESID